MGEQQAAPAANVIEQEAASRLRSFEVGISHVCNDLGTNYAEFAKCANTMHKFADKPEDAEGKLAPWLVDAIVKAAENEQA